MPNQVLASVDSVKGQAFAQGSNGELRPLNAGDPLYDGETLIADPDSKVTVAPDDGSSPYQVAGPIQLAMAADIPADEAEMDPETLADIIEQFQHGNQLPPTEAGGGGGSRGHTLVVLERIVELVTPAAADFDAEPLMNEGPFQGLSLSISSSGGSGEGGAVTLPPAPEPDLSDRYEAVEGSDTRVGGGRAFGSVLDNDGAAPGAT
ncbi:MAG: retention module-containing protein, partial [Azoarcus sp.]|nr:retention module-containing protein [Azoarcus sp.]